MESSKVGYWLQVGANIGILLGLVLVGFQMRQNSDLLRIQLMQQNADQISNRLWAGAGEEFPAVWEKHIVDPKNLTLGEMKTIDAMYWGLINRWRHQYELYKEGLLSAEVWRNDVEVSAGPIFNNAYGRSYWRELDSEATLPKELRLHIEDSLKHYVGSQDFFMRVRNGVQD